MRPVLALLSAAALLLGCGDDDDTAAVAASSSSTSSPSTTAGDPLYPGEPSLPDPGGAGSAPRDVAEALAMPDGSVVRVSGFLIALPDGTATLCGGPVGESAPPQCGDPALPVDGLADAASLPGVTDRGTWVDGDVVLEGTLEGGRLHL